MKLVPIKERKSFNGKICNDIQKHLKGNELRLYMLLCQWHHSNYDYAYPTYKEIREYFGKGWDDKRIRGHLKGLEEKGFIQVDKNKKRAGFDNNIYRVFGIETAYDLIDRDDNIKLLRHKLSSLEGERNAYSKTLYRYVDNPEHTEFMKSEIDRLDKEIEITEKEIAQIKKSLLNEQ